MGSIRLLAVVLFVTWISTSNALMSTGTKKGCGSSTSTECEEPIPRVLIGIEVVEDHTDVPVDTNRNSNLDNATDIPPRVGQVGAPKPRQVLVRVHNATADTLRSHLTTIALPIVYIVVCVVGLPANTMALWVFLFRTKKKRPSTIYMANLALSDVLFVVWIPLKVFYHFNGNDWIFGEGLCKVLVGFFYANMYCSVLFVACLSVQRCWVVVDPFLSKQKANNKMAIGVCVCIWVFIWTTTAPLYQCDQTVRIKDLDIITCHDVGAVRDINDHFASIKYTYYYFMLMATVVFLIPCMVIAVAYVLMFWHLEKKALHNVNRTSEKKRHKTFMLMATVLVTFLVCFIPSNVMLVIHYITNDGYSFYMVTLCLASLNSCLDPFVYYFVSDDFRKHVKNTLLCRSRRTVERMETVAKYSRKNTKVTIKPIGPRKAL